MDTIVPTTRAEMTPLRGDVPWDVLAAIIGAADLRTLKALSLVCRDFCQESAPALCRCFVVVANGYNSGAASLLIQAHTLILQEHTRSRHIKRIYVHIPRSMGIPRWVDDRSELKGTFPCLFSAIQQVKHLQSLHLEIDDTAVPLERCLRELPLPPTLTHFHIRTPRPCAINIPPIFFTRHGARLRSLTVLDSAVTAPLPVALPSLEHLCITSPKSTHIVSNTASLKSLEIQLIMDRDIASEGNWPDFVLSPVGSTAMCVPSSWTSIANFRLRFMDGDPASLYTLLIAGMPNLRKLDVTHDKFRTASGLPIAIAVLQRLERLEEFKWRVFSPEEDAEDDARNMSSRLTEDPSSFRALRCVAVRFYANLPTIGGGAIVLPVPKQTHLILVRDTCQHPWTVTEGT